MTKTISVSNKTHKKIKRDATDEEMTIRDFVENKLGVIVIATILSLGSLGLIYAEEIDLPVDQPFDDQYCTFLATSDHVIFTCSWKWFLPEYIMAEIDLGDIPAKLSDIPQHNLELADKIKLLIEQGEPAQEAPIIEERDEEVVEDDEPKTFEERQIADSIAKLDECLRGVGAWQAYQSQTEIKYFLDESRYSFADRDNLSQNIPILRILKAIEECDIMRTYERMHLIGAYELNKVLADIADTDYLGRGSAHPLEKLVTDQSDAMVETDPVTDKDIADEIEDMEKIFDETYRDPNEDFTGINRGGQPLGLKCQIHGQPAPIGIHPTEKCPLSNYDAHILKNWDSITYKDILALQCDNFLYIYQHKIGTHEFPVWLNHCVPKVVRGE